MEIVWRTYSDWQTNMVMHSLSLTVELRHHSPTTLHSDIHNDSLRTLSSPPYINYPKRNTTWNSGIAVSTGLMKRSDAGPYPGPPGGLQVRFRDNPTVYSGVRQLNDSAMTFMAPAWA